MERLGRKKWRNLPNLCFLGGRIRVQQNSKNLPVVVGSRTKSEMRTKFVHWHFDTQHTYTRLSVKKFTLLGLYLYKEMLLRCSLYGRMRSFNWDGKLPYVSCQVCVRAMAMTHCSAMWALPYAMKKSVLQTTFTYQHIAFMQKRSCWLESGV